MNKPLFKSAQAVAAKHPTAIWVWDFGVFVRVWKFGVWGSRFQVWDLKLHLTYLLRDDITAAVCDTAVNETAANLFGVWGLGFGVWGLGFGVWVLGFGSTFWYISRTNFGSAKNPTPMTCDV